LAAALRRAIMPPVIAIELRDGTAVPTRGEPPAGLIAEFAATGRDLQLSRGTIYVVNGSKGLTLEFSPDIPESTHQRFRNVFGVHRHRIKG
jgi:hypothetical protein